MNNHVNAQQMKIAYIGGGSSAWAWKLMSDLSCDASICGEVLLYDIDALAAKRNEAIGNMSGNNRFLYKAVTSLKNALTGADFVVVSIFPGNLDAMQSDVHAPEELGIYQAVGDTTGPGGLIRAMRTIPMYIEIAKAIETYSPNAWVINYTNPMAMCTDTLYRIFPKIKAFGCCHEVFGTQKLLAAMLSEMAGIKDVPRQDIKLNVKGINHFTWVDKANYKNIDLFPMYKEFAKKHFNGIDNNDFDETCDTRMYSFTHRVKFDLFLRYGVIAAAGDRHLAEFCPSSWYLKDPQTVREWGFGLTTVAARREEYRKRYFKTKELLDGSKKFEHELSGEEGVLQMKALMGMEDLVTNVNLPNLGQISNMPYGRIVETNAHFSADSVTPVLAGPLDGVPHSLTMRVSTNFDNIVTNCLKGDIDACLGAFQNDPLVTTSPAVTEKLFYKMIENTSEWLKYYK